MSTELQAELASLREVEAAAEEWAEAEDQYLGKVPYEVGKPRFDAACEKLRKLTGGTP